MHPKMFGYPVEVSKHDKKDLPFNKDFNRIEILQCLNSFFGHSNIYENAFDFYEVNRPGFGIDHSITVLSNPNNEYFTIRIFVKPELNSSEIAFSPAAYSKERIRQLYTALRDHYPPTYFLHTKQLLIILQRFMFYPVCQFTTPEEIKGLLEIIWYASRACILLDYNHNHWLVSNKGNIYYVDSDFMGQVYQDRFTALSENFNQSMVFINAENCKLLAKVLPEFATRGSDFSEFLEEYFKVVVNYLECWKTAKNVLPSVQRKLDCLNKLINDFWIS